VFATSHVLTIHPIMAAKQATTIDHITGGRFALNVVTGWHRSEIEMFDAGCRPPHTSAANALSLRLQSSSNSNPTPAFF
jgi:alkanesulfonate monooxygenase SsuD/methylene tetrahydromethanopterin reductase-like flavin-dependent oxidoreductase (luciferase family)